MASTLNITADQGATFRRVFVLKDGDGDVIDITGASVYMQVRRNRDDDVILDASTDNGRVTIVGASGQITVVVSASVMAAVEAGGVYDLFVQFLGGDRVKLLKGTFSVERSVTEIS